MGQSGHCDIDDDGAFEFSGDRRATGDHQEGCAIDQGRWAVRLDSGTPATVVTGDDDEPILVAGVPRIQGSEDLGGPVIGSLQCRVVLWNIGGDALVVAGSIDVSVLDEQ